MSSPCEKCDGDMYYLVANYRLEVMERIECMDCISHEHYKHHLGEELTKIIVKASPQKLASIVSELIVCGIDNNTHDDLERIETIIQTRH